MSPRWINTQEACRRTGLSRSWFEKHRHELPCYRVGRLYLYDPEELDRWIASHKVEPRKDEIKRMVDAVVDRIFNNKERMESNEQD